MNNEVADCIRAFVAERGPGKTVCPSEVARRLDAADWRQHMDDVRRAAAELAARGEIVVSQRGEPVDPHQAKGPIRLGLPKS